MKKVLVALLIVAFMFSLVACSCNVSYESSKSTEAASGVSQAADSDLAYIKGNGKLIVGITDFEPMDYKDDAGKWIGFDADLATKFADYLGIGVEFVEIDWDNKILELNGKTVDCIWNGMTLTDEVKSSMDCSDAYLNNAQIVIVNKADADKYTDAESCKDLTFAVEAGSAGQEQAEANGFNFTEVKDQATALMEVASGTSDAAIIDSLMAAAMVGEGTSYEDLAYTVKLNSEEYGVGFRQGSDLVAEFKKFFDDATSTGVVAEIAKQYKVEASLIG